MHADPAIYSHTPIPFNLWLHPPQSPPYPRNCFLIFVSSIKVCIFVHFWCVCCLHSYRFWIQLYLCISDWQADQWIQLVMTLSLSQNLPVVDSSAEKDRPWGPLPHGWTLTASALCYYNAGYQCCSEFMISMAVPFSENGILQSSLCSGSFSPLFNNLLRNREWHNWFICGWVLTWPVTTLLKLGEAVLYEFKCIYVERNYSRNHYPGTYTCGNSGVCPARQYLHRFTHC